MRANNFGLSFILSPMTTYTAALDAANKAAQATFSLLDVDTIDDIDERSFWLFADDVEGKQVSIVHSCCCLTCSPCPLKTVVTS